MAKFSANFWGSDFCSTAGYDVLVKRLKEGKRMCQDFEEYLDRRARIEKEYGDNLLKLARSASGKDEIGSLRKSWEELKAETEAIGRVHTTLAQKIAEELSRSLKEFREQQRDVRKKSEDTVKRSAAHKRQSFERNNRMKLTYESKCREADKAEDTYNRFHSNPATKLQDLTRSQKRMESSKAAANNADSAYQEAVKNLEEARSLWEREMEILCKQFQELEEQRAAFLRHQMWTYCNLLSQSTVSVDEACESVRKVLEDCNVDADIDLFVREKATGSDHPPEILYENYYHPTQMSGNLGGSGVRVPGPISFVDPPRKELPPLPPVPEPAPEELGGIESMYSSIPEDLKVDHSTAEPEAYYAAPRPLEKVIAVYDYEAQGDQEINLSEGDIIQIVAKEDDVWWCGQLKGKLGMFPSAYVEVYEGQSLV